MIIHPKVLNFSKQSNLPPFPLTQNNDKFNIFK